MTPVAVTAYSAFKTPATTEYFFDFKERTQIDELINLSKEVIIQGLPILHIWGGTNCLFAFDHFPGLIVRHRLKGIETRLEGLWSASGELVSPLASYIYTELHSQSMIPWIGLPGTVGGAVTGNAGCFGLETADILLSAEILSLSTGDISHRTPENLGYTYRESDIKGQSTEIVLSALWNIHLVQTDNMYTKLTIQEMQDMRRTKQPPGPSCGSYFKNPSGTSAGRLIDEAGLKGMKVWGMQISPYHANFFINTGWALYTEVLELAAKAKDAVFTTTGILLEEEVRIIYSPDLP